MPAPRTALPCCHNTHKQLYSVIRALRSFLGAWALRFSFCRQEGSLNAEFVITHKMALSEAADGYAKFNKKEDGCLKVVLFPGK